MTLCCIAEAERKPQRQLSTNRVTVSITRNHHLDQRSLLETASDRLHFTFATFVSDEFCVRRITLLRIRNQHVI